ncbi:hypothetical protein EYC84_005053 [Monilinia fructicola]|uniref:NAP family protein n=1 Tax=Monilinia fructicola TaxID=38448 RepID=A0A5M9JVC9_MONFR|nr:hypothetical protein EYC84_005053 [Monilinia fructicola]
MRQTSKFTTTAMAAALEETPVSYEDLAEIEREFDDVETEMIRQQIPSFWALVLEQAPPDIDQYIQPSDSSLLLSSLTSLRVSRFELENPDSASGGDPRSVSIAWKFSPNEYFEDEELVKKFWYRKGAAGWCGLVSEPVRINWKKGKDLTGGLLQLVCDAWDEEQKAKANGEKDGKKDLTPLQKALQKEDCKYEHGRIKFLRMVWIHRSKRISEKQSREAYARESEKREARKAGKKVAEAEEDDDDEDEEDIRMSLEIFPDGDELAISITEDLWPGAIKYFTAAQEQDALSDADFESNGEEDASIEAERPKKKQRSS